MATHREHSRNQPLAPLTHRDLESLLQELPDEFHEDVIQGNWNDWVDQNEREAWTSVGQDGGEPTDPSERVERMVKRLSTGPSNGNELYIIHELAELPPGSLLDEKALATVLRINERTIRRMVERSELPPPVTFGNRRLWLVKKVVEHFSSRADEASAEMAARRKTMERHRP